MLIHAQFSTKKREDNLDNKKMNYWMVLDCYHNVRVKLLQSQVVQGGLVLIFLELLALSWCVCSISGYSLMSQRVWVIQNEEYCKITLQILPR